ncbi:MAG: hypothetical protein NC223_09895 [Butyrivibrio sp.]|nr:hypothetical protein [Butyrivibrio sp.]
MAKINGTYVSLHEEGGGSPYYTEGLEFEHTLCLADCFEKTGGLDQSDTYQFKGIPFENKEASEAKMRETEALFDGKIPAKTLLFTESNSAHHLTYFYVKEAKKSLSDNDKLLVINFDQHLDTGSSDSAFYCGSWGGNRICQAVGCDYLAVGPKYIGRTDFGSLAEYFEYKKQNAGKPAHPYAVKLYTSDGSVVSCEAASPQSLYDRYDKIYVTVDMDVLTCGEDLKRTNWGSGNMSLNQLKSLLSELPANKLIAADITGFPPVNSEKAENFKELLSSYIDEIRELSEILRAHLDA